MDKYEIEKTIKAYLENGIVTKTDVISMGGYDGSKVLHEKLKEYLEDNGYEDRSQLHQMRYSNEYDYQDVIFDTNIYSYDEAKVYVYKHVLNK